MSFAPDSPRETESLADPKALLRVPVGFASPLWPLFAGVAVSGAAWWWMTRWAQPANLEAMFGAMKAPVDATSEAASEAASEALAVAEPVAEAGAEPFVDALSVAEPALETAAETFVEPVVEAASASVLEAIAEEPASFAPLGGESAPISPVLEAMSPAASEAPEVPKPRKKPIAPTAD